MHRSAPTLLLTAILPSRSVLVSLPLLAFMTSQSWVRQANLTSSITQSLASIFALNKNAKFNLSCYANKKCVANRSTNMQEYILCKGNNAILSLSLWKSKAEQYKYPPKELFSDRDTHYDHQYNNGNNNRGNGNYYYNNKNNLHPRFRGTANWSIPFWSRPLVGFALFLSIFVIGRSCSWFNPGERIRPSVRMQMEQCKRDKAMQKQEQKDKQTEQVQSKSNEEVDNSKVETNNTVEMKNVKETVTIKTSNA